MLWSLVKIILFVVLVGAMAFGAGYLMDLGGGVRIAFGGIELNLGPLQAVIGLILLLLALWLVLKLAGLLVAVLRFVNGDETAITRYFSRNRERKGLQALSEALVALASGEGRLAMAKAARAEKFLHRPELTNLVTAQAAEMIGDHRRAEEVYKALLADERTRFVGIRGILKQRLAEGDTDTALKLAEKAFALKPRHEEVQDILLQLQAQKHDWKGARRTLNAKLRHGQLPRDVYRRRDAVLALAEAEEVFAEGNSIEAREEAIEANRLSPDLIPAAVMAARAYMEQGKPRLATRILVKAWEVRPHPDLAAAFAEIVPDETPQERLKRFQTLIRANPDHDESRMLLAELEIAAEDFPAARRALGDLPTRAPTARALTLMAAIERGEGAPDSVVRGWLAKAVTAPRGPQWVCENCHTVHSSWMPVCSVCGAFDTLAWTTPPEAEAPMAGSTGMLPLLVGEAPPAEGPDDTPEDTPADTPAGAPAEVPGQAASGEALPGPATATARDDAPAETEGEGTGTAPPAEPIPAEAAKDTPREPAQVEDAEVVEAEAPGGTDRK